MSNKRSNYPNNQQPDVEPGEMGELVARMEELRKLPPVKSDDEIERRIQWYFNWCIERDIRPGVEGLALACGTTRVSLWKWQQAGGRRGELVTGAKQVLAALLESWGQTGKINPAALCFLMKNSFGYADNVQVDFMASNSNPMIPTRTAAEIARDRGIIDMDALPPEPEKPEI